MRTDSNRQNIFGNSFGEKIFAQRTTSLWLERRIDFGRLQTGLQGNGYWHG